MRVICFCLLLAASTAAQIAPLDFKSNFESGNVANIHQIGVDSFTFEITLDNIPGDTYGWYYFAIVGNHGRVARLFLTNPDGWQNESCNPLYSFDNIHWGRVSNVWREGNWLAFSQMLGADTVWFAQGFPFTLSRLNSYLDSLCCNSNVNVQTLGESPHGRPIKIITITDPAYPGSNKKTAWLISRQHPMESGPTFLLRGFLDNVVDTSAFARRWRRDIILKVIPIVNVDGVTEGYSRQNSHGVNLNRDWHQDFLLEEPEVRAAHEEIVEYLSSGSGIDLFMDLHAAPDNYDFGFRMSLSYTNQPYFQNQETFLHLLETFDTWQDRTRWRDLDTNYAFGVSCVVLYDMYGLDAFSSEIPWTRRDDNSLITAPSIIYQGRRWTEAIYNYLYPLTLYTAQDSVMDSIVPGEPFDPRIWDFDQVNKDSLTVSVSCHESGDLEQITLHRTNDDGIFEPHALFPTDTIPAVAGDGILSIRLGDQLAATYIDPDLPSRTYHRYLPVGSQCVYVPGDVNGSGVANGTDVVYLVNYLKGGPSPPIRCACGAVGAIYVAADANGSCDINGLDITYLVNYFKRGGVIQFCIECPPEFR